MTKRDFACNHTAQVLNIGTADPSLQLRLLFASASLTKSSVSDEFKDILYSAAPFSRAARKWLHLRCGQR